MMPGLLRAAAFFLIVALFVLGIYEPARGFGTLASSNESDRRSHLAHEDDRAAVQTLKERRRQGLWVFTDEITESSASVALLDYAADRSHNRLYVSVYRGRPNSTGQLIYEHDLIRRFIQDAHERGLEVWAAYGDPEWPALGCSEGSFPCERLQEILSYNSENPDAAFDGIMLDVEPENDAELLRTLELFRDVLWKMRAGDLSVATSINAFWDAKLAFPHAGEVKPAFQHVLDLPFDHVLVMCYRNFAAGPNGAIELCEDELLYAEAQPNQNRIVVGLRTTAVDFDGGWRHESFSGMNPEHIDDAVNAINNYFERFDTFDGVAFHRYSQSVHCCEKRR